MEMVTSTIAQLVTLPSSIAFAYLVYKILVMLEKDRNDERVLTNQALKLLIELKKGDSDGKNSEKLP